MTAPTRGVGAEPDALALPTGAERVEVSAAGVAFSVLRAGTGGTPVLLLHGVPQTSDIWYGLIAELSSDRLVLAPDLKGLGRSQVVGSYDIPTLVRELAALVDVLLGEPGPVDVVGHDWGGALAIALCGARPDLVRRLVVVNAPYREVDLVRAWHMPLFALPVVPDLLLSAAGRQFWRAVLAKAWKGPVRLDPALRESYLDAYDTPERRAAMLAYYRGTTRPRLKALPGRLLQALRGKVVPAPRVRPHAALVVWGTADPAFPRRIGEGVARDLGARFVPVEGSGHFVVEENPAVVLPAIAEFLRAPAEVGT